MSAFFPTPTRLSLADIKVEAKDGRGFLSLGEDSFISVDTALEARHLAIAASELANEMDAAQRTKETSP